MTEVLTHRVDGDGDVVLLLNGGMMTMAAWEPFAAPLAERFKVLRCDLRGQLLSPGEGPRRLEGHVDDVVALLDHLGLDAVHVIGTSFGAMVGTLLAATAPARVRSLVAVTATDVPSDALRQGTVEMRRIVGDVVGGGDRGAFHEVMVGGVFSPEYIEAHREEFAARRAQIDLLPVAWFEGLLAILECTEAMDLRPHLGQVRCPSFVVSAAADLVMSAERSRALAEALGAEEVLHPSAGHGLVAEDPAWLVETCLAFLERRA